MKIKLVRPGELIGILPSGRRVYAIAGGSDDQDDSNSNDDDGGDGGQDDDEDLLGGDEDSSDGEDKDDKQPDIQALLDKQKEDLTAAFTSEIDRRINQVVKKKTAAKRQPAQQQEPEPTGPKPSEVREARLVYREYVSDEVQFVVPEEREIATNLATGVIRDRLENDADPEEAGREAAKEAAKQIKSLRRKVQNRTIDQLIRQGHLPEGFKASKTGQPNRQQQQAGSSNQPDWTRGEQLAKEMYASRVPQQT